MATDIPAASGELGTVILGARDLRQHALRFDRKNLHLTAAMISLSARKHLIARKVSHCSKNLRGAEAFSAFVSVLQTARKTHPASLTQSLLACSSP